MPKRKTYSSRRPQIRRKRKRTYWRRRPLTTVRRLPLTGFPQKKLVRMRYTESVIINPGATFVAYHEFLANSIYDPNFGGVGHQPRGHDQWATIYNHYYVLGAKFYAQCMPSTSSATVPGVWGVSCQHAPALYSGLSVDQVIESKRVNPYKVRTCGGGPSFGFPRQVATAKFSAKKMYEKNRSSLLSYEDGGANFGSSPNEQPTFTVWYGHAASNDPAPQEFKCTIEYIVLLTDPKQLDES